MMSEGFAVVGWAVANNRVLVGPEYAVPATLQPAVGLRRIQIRGNLRIPMLQRRAVSSLSV